MAASKRPAGKQAGRRATDGWQAGRRLLSLAGAVDRERAETDELERLRWETKDIERGAHGLARLVAGSAADPAAVRLLDGGGVGRGAPLSEVALEDRLAGAEFGLVYFGAGRSADCRAAEAALAAWEAALHAEGGHGFFLDAEAAGAVLLLALPAAAGADPAAYQRWLAGKPRWHGLPAPGAATHAARLQRACGVGGGGGHAPLGLALAVVDALTGVVICADADRDVLEWLRAADGPRAEHA